MVVYGKIPPLLGFWQVQSISGVKSQFTPFYQGGGLSKLKLMIFYGRSGSALGRKW